LRVALRFPFINNPLLYDTRVSLRRWSLILSTPLLLLLLLLLLLCCSLARVIEAVRSDVVNALIGW
jgi:hypothetical protein